MMLDLPSGRPSPDCLYHGHRIAQSRVSPDHVVATNRSPDDPPEASLTTEATEPDQLSVVLRLANLRGDISPSGKRRALSPNTHL